jgi:hypothetical protein
MILSALILTCNFAFASEGKVIRLKGNAKYKLFGKKSSWVDLNKGDVVPDKCTVKTEKKSFLLIKYPKKVTINIGAKSSYKVDLMNAAKGSSYYLMYGKMRALIETKLTDKDKINFNNQAVALGVRGTEFLQNAYIVKGKATSDVALIKGRLAVDASASAPKVKSFTLQAGQSFNTSELALNGMSAVKDIPSKLLESLKSGTDFMTNLQLPTGAVAPIGIASAGIAGLASGIGNALGSVAGSVLGSGSGNKEDKEEEKPEKPKKKAKPKKVAKKKLKKKEKKPKTMVQGLREFKYIPKDEPQEIREPLLTRKRDRKNNKCYYYIYRQVGGYGPKLLFKRTRDCDDYDYDL